jgi:hypothetical protein
MLTNQQVREIILVLLRLSFSELAEHLYQFTQKYNPNAETYHQTRSFSHLYPPTIHENLLL